MSVSYISPSLHHAVVLHGRLNKNKVDKTNVYKVCQVVAEKGERHWNVVKEFDFEEPAIKLAEKLG